MNREPSRLSWVFKELPSSDAHTLHCRFSCSARIADNPADRKMFAEVFGAQNDNTTPALIAAHFESTLNSKLTSHLSQCKAADAVGGSHPQEWISTLLEATKSQAFSCGLELLPPFQLDIESPSLQRQRIEEITQTRTKDQFQRATELLAQFQAMRQFAPEVSAGELLERLSPADRGLTLQSLLLATSGPSHPSTLVAVAGSNLLQIDARAVPPSITVNPLTTELGPFRSIQQHHGTFLIGAHRGVISVSAQNPSATTLYPCDTGDSQLGFNRVVCDGKQIFASHSDAGIVVWSMENPAEITVHPEHGARALHQLDDSRLIYSVGHELIIRHQASRAVLESHSQTDVIGIILTAKAALALHQDGTLISIDRFNGKIIDVRRRGANLSSACAMPWFGDMRLLLATDQGPIDCIGMEDSLTTEYLSPYRGLKIVDATADLIAAVSPDRQRIIVWNSWDSHRPIGEVHVTAKVKHRIADLRFTNVAI